MTKIELPNIVQSAPLFPENKTGYFVSPLAALELRSLLRQVDKKVSMVELGIEFGACDPRSRYGREVLRHALKKERKDVIARFGFEPKVIIPSSDRLSVTQIEIPDDRTLEMRKVVAHNLAKQRGQEIDAGAPDKDYVLVGPLITASVCTVARHYLEEVEQPTGFAVSVVEDVLDTYYQIN